MSARNALATLAITLATMVFALGWLTMDHAPEPAPLIARAAEPCLQLADLPRRKAYSPADIARLCEHQQHDERFHGNPKRVRP